MTRFDKIKAIEKMKALQYELEVREARSNVWNAANFLYPNVFEDRGATKEVAEAYQLVLDRKIEKLRISAPPRFTKTFLKNIFTFLYLGNNPMNLIMSITGTEELAIDSSKFVRDGIAHSEDVNILFPDLRVNPKDASKSSWKLVGSERPSFVTGGIFSKNIGKGANLLVTDDIFSSFGEYSSEVSRRKILQERFTTLDDRTENDINKNPPQIIDLGTSWGKEDHFNINSRNGYYDLEVKVAAFTDIGGKMITVCPAWRTTEWLERKKASMDTYEWEASYMQNPIVPEGLMYRDGFTTYARITEEIHNNSKLRCVVDPANQGDDFLVAIAYYEYIVGRDRFAYVKDVLYTKADMTQTLIQLPNFLIQNEVVECVIEINKESMFVNWMEEKMKDAGHFKTMFKPYYQRQNKLERIREYTTAVQKNIIFPENWKGKWKEFSSGILTFPRVPGKKAKDDHVDCLTKVAEETVGSLKKVILV